MRRLVLIAFFAVLACSNHASQLFAEVVINIYGTEGESEIDVSFSGTLSINSLFVGGINSFSFSAPSGTFYEGPFSQTPNNNLAVQNITTGAPEGISEFIDFNNGPNTDTIRLLFLSPTVSGSRGDLIEFRGSELISLEGNATFDDFVPGSFVLTNSNTYLGEVTLNIVMGPAPPPLLGDVNLDGDVNFLDVSPFTAVLFRISGYRAEADCNQDELINFLDIAPFIAILSD